MRLYHYTHAIHLSSIRSDGFIRPTESNVGSPSPQLRPFGDHVGPDVVWLTSSEQCGGHGLVINDDQVVPPEWDKRKLRLVVEVEDAQPWERWVRQHAIHPRWKKALMLSAPGYPTWYVVERPVTWDEVVDVEGDPELVEWIAANQ